MAMVGKVFALFFVIIMTISSVIMVNSVIAQEPTPTPTPVILADYWVDASAGPGGTISPKGGFTSPGTIYTFTITPNPGYKILDVKDNGESKGAIPTYTLDNIHENHDIVASFSIASNPVMVSTPKVPELSPNTVVLLLFAVALVLIAATKRNSGKKRRLYFFFLFPTLP